MEYDDIDGGPDDPDNDLCDRRSKEKRAPKKGKPMVDRKKVGRRSKNKGKDYERYLAHKLNKWAGLENEKAGSFKRRWSGRAETPEGGDLINPPWFNIIIEARKRENWNFDDIMRNGFNSIIARWWEEMAVKNKTHHLMLIFSKNRQPDYVAFTDTLDMPVAKTIEDVALITIVLPLTPCKLWILKLDDLLERLDSEEFKPNPLE